MTSNSDAVPPVGAVNGESSSNGVMLPMANEVMVETDQQGCHSCHQLQEQLLACKKEQAFYSELKKKIVLTDALIRRYNTKCQEYDLQQRKVDELTRKLASSKRDCKLLEEQLAKALKEIIPWKREKTKFMEEYENNKRKLVAAQDALIANQTGISQYNIQIDEQEKALNAQRKETADAKNRVKHLQQVLDRRKSVNVEDYKNEIAQLKKEKNKISTSFEKAKLTLLKLKNLLHENNIHVPRVPSQFLPKKTAAAAAAEVDLMSDNSDDSMISNDDEEDNTVIQAKPATQLIPLTQAKTSSQVQPSTQVKPSIQVKSSAKVKPSTRVKPTSSKPQEKEELPEPAYIRRIQSILDRKEAASISTPSTSTSKPGSSYQKVRVKQESSSDEGEDNVSGSEMMSHVADEIDAQLNLTESDNDIKQQPKVTTKKTGTHPGKTPARKTYGRRISQQSAKSNERQTVKNVRALRGAATKPSVKKVDIKKESKEGKVKQLDNVSSQKQQSPKNLKSTKQSERLSSTESDSSSSSDEDDDVKSSIASRTRTRTQSQSGNSGTEQSPGSKPIKAAGSDKSPKVKRQKAMEKGMKQSRGRMLSRKSPLTKETVTTSDSDSSDDDKEMRMSPPRTRSQSQSGNSGYDRTQSNRGKVGVKREIKASAALSETSDEELCKTNSKASEDSKGPNKATVDKTLSDTSDDEVFKTRTNKQSHAVKSKKELPKCDKTLTKDQQDVKPGATLRESGLIPDEGKTKTRKLVERGKHSLSDTSDDDWNPSKNQKPSESEEGSQPARKVRKKKEPQSEKSDKDASSNLAQDKKLSSSGVAPRLRRNTDTDLVLARHPRRSRRLTRQTSGGVTEDVDLGTRAFLSDGDQPLSPQHGRIYDPDESFQSHLKRAKQLKDSSGESEDEPSEQAENSTKNNSTSVVNNKMEEPSSDTEKCVNSKSTPDEDTVNKTDQDIVKKQKTKTRKLGSRKSPDVQDTDRVSPPSARSPEEQGSSKKSNQNIHLKIPSTPKETQHPVRAENLVLSPEDSSFRKKFLKPISPVRSSPRRRPGSNSSADTTPIGDIRSNPFFPVRPATRSTIQNLSASFISAGFYAPEGSNQESSVNKAGTSGFQTRLASKVKANVSDDDPINADAETSGANREHSQQESVRPATRSTIQNLSASFVSAGFVAPEGSNQESSVNKAGTSGLQTRLASKVKASVSDDDQSNADAETSGDNREHSQQESVRPATRSTIQNLSASFVSAGFHAPEGSNQESSVNKAGTSGLQTRLASKVKANVGDDDQSNADAETSGDNQEHSQQESVRPATRSTIQNLSASFASAGFVAPESSNQESSPNKAGTSGLQTSPASKMKDNVSDDGRRNADAETSGSNQEHSQQESEGADLTSPDPQSKSTGKTKLDSKRRKRVTRSRSSDSKASDMQSDVEENSNQDAKELLQSEKSNVPVRITRSRITRSRSKEDHESVGTSKKSNVEERNNEETKDIAQTSQAITQPNKNVKEEVQFAAPISTRSFNSRRRTRTMSSTSSCSDVSNQSDLVEHQSTLGVESSSGTEPPRRRTRSMSARRQQDPKPVRITRSMSEPRKADLKKMKNDINNGGNSVKPIKKECEPEKADLKLKSKEVAEDLKDSKVKDEEADGEKQHSNNSLDGKEEVQATKTPAPGKRVTRLQALNQQGKDSGQSTSSATCSVPKQESKKGKGKNNKRNVNAKRTRSKAWIEESDTDSEDDEKVVKKLKGDETKTRTTSNTSHHEEDGLSEDDNDVQEPVKRNTPSPEAGSSNTPPILAPFQNYASPQEIMPPPLPQLFEEQDRRRHLSPVSPIPEPFQNFDGERALSPLPISPSETPPIMERPLSALSLPDLPPLPPLVTPLPPSPLRSLLTRSSSRLANPVRMVSPLTTPPPRAISPLPQPPMPDAISPLKDDDSMDSVQHRLNLIPSPRNFHAVAPRHAVAVPPHPTGCTFQAARCRNNFDAENDIAGPSGVRPEDLLPSKNDKANDEDSSLEDNEDTDVDSGDLVINAENVSTDGGIENVSERETQHEEGLSSKNNEMSSDSNATLANIDDSKEVIKSPSQVADDDQDVTSESSLVPDSNANSAHNVTGNEFSHNIDEDKKQAGEDSAKLEDMTAGSRTPFQIKNEPNKNNDPMDKTKSEQDESVKEVGHEETEKKQGKGTRKKGQKKGNDISDKRDDKSTSNLPQVSSKYKMDDNKGTKGSSEQGRKRRSSTRSTKKQDHTSEADNDEDSTKDADYENEPLTTTRRARRKSNLTNEDRDREFHTLRRQTRSMRHSENEGSVEKSPDGESHKLSAKKRCRASRDGVEHDTEDDHSKEDDSLDSYPNDDDGSKPKGENDSLEVEEPDKSKDDMIEENNTNVGCSSAKKSRKVRHPSKDEKKEKNTSESAAEHESLEVEEPDNSIHDRIEENTTNISNMSAKKSRRVRHRSKDAMKETNAPQSEAGRMQKRAESVEDKKEKLLKTASITPGKHSSSSETNQELLEVLEQQGVVTSETELVKTSKTEEAADVKGQTSKTSSKPPNVKTRTTKTVCKLDILVVQPKSATRPSPTNVQHKVTTKPCSSQLALSKRTAIMIAAPEMRDRGFKRPRSMQRRSSELNKAKPEKVAAATVPTVAEATPATSSDGISKPTDANSSPITVTGSLPLIERQSAKPEMKQSAAKSEAASPPPTVGNAMAHHVNVSASLKSKDVPNEAASPESPTCLSPPPIDVIKAKERQETVMNTIHERQKPLVPNESPVSNPAGVPGGPAPVSPVMPMVKDGTQNNAAPFANDVKHDETTSQTAAVTGKTSISTDNSSNVNQGQSMKMPPAQATSQVVAAAQKGSSKIGNLWGTIAKDTKKQEKAIKEEASEVYKTLTVGKKTQNPSKPGNAMTRKVGEQNKPEGSSVASVWGDFVKSGADQQELSRRRKKSMPNKGTAKQKKLKDTDRPGTASTKSNKMTAIAQARVAKNPNNKGSPVNDAHIQQTLTRIASYRMGTNANNLVERIAQNIQYNAMDLLPVIYARCLANNTSTQPVLTPVEDKLITAIIDWTKKNNCTTLVECLLTFLHQAIQMETLISPSETAKQIPKEKKFPMRSTFCRLYAILCLHTDNIQCARVFAYDLLRNAYPSSEHLILAVAASWPAVLYKQENTQASPVGSVIETIVMQRLSNMIGEERTQQAFTTLCGWRPHRPDSITNITQQLVAMIQDANCAQLINENDPNLTLNQMAFEVSKAMELLAFSMGWEWTNNILIRDHLWPVLKKWTLGLRAESSIKNGSACLVMKIIAIVGIPGLAKNKTSVSEVMRMLLAVLQQPSEIIPWCVQLYTADAILQLSASRPTLSHPILEKWSSEASQPIPASLTERIRVLGSWVVNTNKRRPKMTNDY